MDKMYNSVFSDLEKAVYMETLRNEIQMKELSFMLEMVDSKLELNKKEAELKVLVENGSYDDLEYLYCEAEEEAKKEKKGVISTIVDAIASIFKSIGNAISSFIKGDKDKDPDEELEEDKEAWEATKKININFGPIKKELELPTPTVSGILGVLKTFAALFGGYELGKKALGKIKVKRSEKNAEAEKLNENNTVISNFIDKASNLGGGILEGVKGALTKVGNFFKKVLAKIGIGSAPDETNGTNTNKPDGAAQPDATPAAKTKDNPPKKDTTKAARENDQKRARTQFIRDVTKGDVEQADKIINDEYGGNAVLALNAKGVKSKEYNGLQKRARAMFIRDYADGDVTRADQIINNKYKGDAVAAVNASGGTVESVLDSYFALDDEEMMESENVFGINLYENYLNESGLTNTDLNNIYKDFSF